MPTKKPKAKRGEDDFDLSLIVSHGRRFYQIYRGDWKAAWLLTDIEADRWLLRTKNTRRVGDEWQGCFVLDWSIHLADGLPLTHPKHRAMLDMAKKIVFLVREVANTNISSSVTHRLIFLQLMVVVQWVYLNADRFQPDTQLFRLFDQTAAEDYMRALRDGGVAWVLQVPHRTLMWLYREALGDGSSTGFIDARLLVPAEDCKAIIEWLDKNHFYHRERQDWTGEPIRFIDRKKLADMLHVDVATLRSSPKLVAFLRQFEPDLLAINRHLLLPVRGVRGSELPSHAIPTIDDVMASRYGAISMRHHASTLGLIQMVQNRLPGRVQAARGLNMNLLYSIARTGDEEQHTPWVPLKTALSYTREALCWASIYADPLVDFYLHAIKTFHEKCWFSYQEDSLHCDSRLQVCRDKWISENCPASLNKLGITGWTSWFSRNQPEPFRNLRERPGLNDMMQVLMGAAIVLIGITKPIRESEIIGLRKDAISFVPGDGYWLEQTLAKVVISDRHAQTTKPIPSITARMMTTLKRLSDGVVDLLQPDDPYARERIFFLPPFVRDASLKAKLYAPTDFSRVLNRFCDYVALEPDGFGRRWYVRVHELRKSFLITFFWCFRFSSLDAARWIAGHADAADLYAYIEANFPGEELPQLEADYAAAQLRHFSLNGESEAENTVELYEAVCQHFAVREVSFIPSSAKPAWCRPSLRSKSGFSAAPCCNMDSRSR